MDREIAAYHPPREERQTQSSSQAASSVQRPGPDWGHDGKRAVRGVNRNEVAARMDHGPAAGPVRDDPADPESETHRLGQHHEPWGCPPKPALQIHRHATPR